MTVKDWLIVVLLIVCADLFYIGNSLSDAKDEIIYDLHKQIDNCNPLVDDIDKVG